jgi:NAD(P)H-hydrate repair Nnr-like enzyme with NAD(P)H-hydrate dehydratase domain
LWDILAGAIGACVGWDFHYGPALASWVVKNATRMAFEKEGRSLTAPSIFPFIHPSFK